MLRCGRCAKESCRTQAAAPPVGSNGGSPCQGLSNVGSSLGPSGLCLVCVPGPSRCVAYGRLGVVGRGVGSAVLATPKVFLVSTFDWAACWCVPPLVAGCHGPLLTHVSRALREILQQASQHPIESPRTAMSAAAPEARPLGRVTEARKGSTIGGTMRLIQAKSRLAYLALRRKQALQRLSALASMGNTEWFPGLHVRRSREMSRHSRERHSGAVDLDPEWLHATLQSQARAPNGGRRAWLVVLGYFLVCSSTLGLQYAYSAIYTALLAALDEGPTATALVGSLCAGTMEGFAVLAALTIARYGAQRACQIGAVLAVTGLLLSAACTSVWQVGPLIAMDCHGLPWIAMDCHGLPWIGLDWP